MDQQAETEPLTLPTQIANKASELLGPCTSAAGHAYACLASRATPSDRLHNVLAKVGRLIVCADNSRCLLTNRRAVHDNSKLLVLKACRRRSDQHLAQRAVCFELRALNKEMACMRVPAYPTALGVGGRYVVYCKA